MKSLALSAPTRAMYDAAFEAERAVAYPVVDAFESRMGYAVDRKKLEWAAKTLACPLKARHPNWQHGRVLYASARAFLQGKPSGCWTFLDIGTAKGFSAMCLQWALMDHAGGALTFGVTSVDVVDPLSRERRNTVAELETPKTLFELLRPWPEAEGIRFLQSTGIDFLQNHEGRIDFAFVDGKHRGDTVFKEGALLADHQDTGDVAIFDDVHLPDVRSAVMSLSRYTVEFFMVLPTRAYAIARRK